MGDNTNNNDSSSDNSNITSKGQRKCHVRIIRWLRPSTTRDPVREPCTAAVLTGLAGVQKEHEVDGEEGMVCQEHIGQVALNDGLLAGLARLGGWLMLRSGRAWHKSSR